MGEAASEPTKPNSQIELMQSLFEEIVRIQKENKATDEAVARMQEIVQESDKVTENSSEPTEMMMDAKILQAGSNFVNLNIASLNTNLTSFKEAEYLRGVLTRIANSRGECSGDREWTALCPITYKMFKKTHPLSFSSGSLILEPGSPASTPPPSPSFFAKGDARAETKGAKKQSKEAKVMPMMTEEEEQSTGEGNDVYDHIFKSLVRQYKKNGRKPVSFFNFVIDPNSYWESVLNIFHFSFLVRDGNVIMDIANALPVVEPVFKKGEGAQQEVVNKQFCFALNKRQWQESIDRFQIRSAQIPPFVKKN